MNYDSFFLISCLMGDELYKLNYSDNKQVSSKTLEERFKLVWNQPIDDFYLNGLPSLLRRNARLNNSY